MSRFSCSSLIATGLGLGYLPKAPGTWGSLGALGLYLVLAPRLSLGEELFLGLVFILLGVWAAERRAAWRGVKDPQEVVIDEIAGQWLALMGAGLSFWVLPAFFLFRLFDILKPLPVRQAERLPGGWGIMADDLVAGVLANLVWQAFRGLLG